MLGYTYLPGSRQLVAEVENRIRQTRVERVLQIHLVSLDNTVRILSAPPQNHPRQMVLDHRYHSVSHDPLLRCQRYIEQIGQIRQAWAHYLGFMHMRNVPDLSRETRTQPARFPEKSLLITIYINTDYI